MFNNPRLTLIYGIVLLDVIVGSATGPVLPQFVKHLAQPQLWLALGTALFLGVQLFSAPLLGKLSDAKGRRPLIFLSSIGTLLANALLLPVTAGFFFINRVSDGLTNGMYALMRSSVADVSSEDQLVRNTGLVSTILSMGNVLGPLVAGLVLWCFPNPDNPARLVVLVTLGLAALNVVLSLFFTETVPQKQALAKDSLRHELVQTLHIAQLWQRLKQKDAAKPGLASLTLLTLLLTLNQGYLNYFIPYIGLGQLKLNATQTAYFFVFFGGLSALSNYIYFTYLIDRFDKAKVLVVTAWLGVGLHVVYANVADSKLLLYLAAATDALSVSLIGGLLNGLVAQLTDEDDRGEVFGITQALTGLASLITTLVYGALSVVSLSAPFYWFAATMAALALLAMRVKRSDQPSPQQPSYS